ncbi:beta-ketoacyl synthase N-terminal-like domain-containing protein, partial [Salmonella sp. SAL4357]|uniref:beta-ketoacyl synthase N-terminal-like domain-containing protein n=1 Tax=Salmonella sp. SAL4357 TaxID=3159878 RepID=UPI00397B01E1
PSSPVGEISIHYGVLGPATTLAPGPTASLAALAEGVAQLTCGRADRALVVASDVASPLLQGLTRAPALEDAGAALVLERASDAAARGS